MARLTHLVGLLVALFLVVGCGGSAPYAGSKSADYAAEAPMTETAAAAEPEMYAPGTATAGVDEADDARVAEDAPLAGGAPAPQNAPPPPPAPPPKRTETKPDVPTPAPGAQPEPDTGVATSGQGATIASPMLIYTADVNMAVFEAKKAMDAVEKIARQAGGYLVKRDDRTITVRVPAGKFDGSVTDITKLGDVLHKNVSVQDVTSEYVDLQIRMRNLEVVRKRLEKLLEKADKVPDAIAVEKELERVTGELERMKGRLKLLTELVHFSTITVTFSARPTDHVDSKVRLPFPWLDTLGLGELLRM